LFPEFNAVFRHFAGCADCDYDVNGGIDDPHLGAWCFLRGDPALIGAARVG
jgi:hypothetical protein